MNNFTVIFLLALAASVAIQWWLSQRHSRHILAHRAAVPEAFKNAIPLDAHQKAADYTVTRARFGQFQLIMNTFLLLLWTLGGGLNALDNAWRGLELSPVATGVGFILSVLLLMSLLELPLSLYQTFNVEERFGFNRTTLRVFFLDLLKQTVLTLLIGAPLLALILWLMHSAGTLWWLWVWVVWMGFNLLMLWAYPTLIAPLFNKFKPLDNSDLRQRIENLLSRTGFASNGIMVMDGSRRSSHGNAYFTGFGTQKRIVFFDTLMDQLEPEEIEAVLAHELGHFKHKHVLKQLIVMAGISLLGLMLLGWLIDRPWFFQGLGMAQPSEYAALILFLMVVPIFTFLLQPIIAARSRKHEYEADDFAAAQADGRALIRALVKMYKDNASTLTPDPLHSAFYDSHPPAPLRITHLALKTEGAHA